MPPHIRQYEVQATKAAKQRKGEQRPTCAQGGAFAAGAMWAEGRWGVQRRGLIRLSESLMVRTYQKLYELQGQVRLYCSWTAKPWSRSFARGCIDSIESYGLAVPSRLFTKSCGSHGNQKANRFLARHLYCIGSACVLGVLDDFDSCLRGNELLQRLVLCCHLSKAHCSCFIVVFEPCLRSITTTSIPKTLLGDRTLDATAIRGAGCC